jgi:hypothetical protein
MHPNVGRIEVVDDKMAAVYRRMTGAERLQVANRLFVSALKMMTNLLASDHPEWDAQRVAREVAHRVSHGSV